MKMEDVERRNEKRKQVPRLQAAITTLIDERRDVTTEDNKVR